MRVVTKVFWLILSVSLLFACGGGRDSVEERKEVGKRMHSLGVPSDGVMEVQLPFADGEGYRCTQNSNGDTSHFYDSTRSDLDFGMEVGTVVVAAAEGTVHVHSDPTKTGGFGWYVSVDHGDYWTIYAHLSGFIASEGEHVVAGQPIAYSGGKAGHPGSGTSTGPHLHFGVHSGSNVGVSKRMTVYALNRNTDALGYFVTGDAQASSDFVCGLSDGHIYESRPISGVFSDYQCRSLADSAGVLCWSGSATTCEDGEQHVWYHENNEGGYLSESKSDTWQKCSQTTTDAVNIFAYLEGNYGVGGYGPGTEIEDLTPPVEVPPDFVTNRTWLTTPWGTETYTYGLNESFDTKAQSENIGDGECLSGEIDTITVHFYLSKGYKEDLHSGDGAWRRLDSAIIQCDNLEPGETHTETKNTNIAEWITEPGIYNVVSCVDHPQDDHNNGGDHQEKHESNNCSTEAVFEVLNQAVVNVPNVDFVVSGFTFLQTPLYAGDYARLGAWITNQGTVNATTDIRSSYTVSCNGGSEQLLADDGTMAETMTAGASAWEENLSPVLMPNVVGECTLFFHADYQGNQGETDEENNTATLTVTLLPRPAPNLVITKFQDESGCCTTNLGSRIKPNIWVRNDGPVAPGANVTVIYHIASPVATGGNYILIGYGSIRPDELPPGGTDEDYMDNQWTIPKNNAWKNQWHTVRGCLKADGSAPVGDPNTEVCAYYARYSKK